MRIVLEYHIDGEQDRKAIEAKIRDILQQSADYQHSNLMLEEYPQGKLMIQIFPNDFVDPARSRNALMDVQDYIHLNYT